MSDRRTCSDGDESRASLPPRRRHQFIDARNRTRSISLSPISNASRELGRVLISFDPEVDGGEGDCGVEVSCELVMAGRDASEVLEFVEEAFDEIALAVEVMGCGALLPAIPLGRDVGTRAMVGNELEDGAGVMAAVGDGVPGRLKAVKEGRHGSLVGGLARGDHEAPRQAKAVDDDVDFGAQPASRASDGVIRTPFFPPAACWWTRTTEASRR